MIFRTTNKKGLSGFAAFYAVLVISILLTISIKMLDIALKRQILSSGARESLDAFYAADSGVECALYNDLRIGRRFEAPGQSRAESISCGGSTFVLTSSSPGCPKGVCYTEFSYDLSPSGRVEVLVKKKNDNNNEQIRTLVEARGYNVSSGARKLERAIRTEYGDLTESAF